MGAFKRMWQDGAAIPQKGGRMDTERVTQEGVGMYLVVAGNTKAAVAADLLGRLFCGLCSGAASQAAYEIQNGEIVPCVVTDCEHVALVRKHGG